MLLILLSILLRSQISFIISHDSRSFQLSLFIDSVPRITDRLCSSKFQQESLASLTHSLISLNQKSSVVLITNDIFFIPKMISDKLKIADAFFSEETANHSLNSESHSVVKTWFRALNLLLDENLGASPALKNERTDDSMLLAAPVFDLAVTGALEVEALEASESVSPTALNEFGSAAELGEFEDGRNSELLTETELEVGAECALDATDGAELEVALGVSEL